MNKRTLMIIATVAIFIGASVVYFNSQVFSPSKKVVGSIDKRGIYVGAESGLDAPSDDSDRFARTVSGLNKGWDNIEIGNALFQSGRYEEAASAYKKAYDVDAGNRLFSGNKLIETYEKLSKYGEALAIVEDILKNQQLSERGVSDFTAIRARILVAKQNQSQAAR